MADEPQDIIVKNGRIQPATPRRELSGDHLRGPDNDPNLNLSPSELINQVVGIDQELGEIYDDLACDASEIANFTAQTKVGVLKFRSDILFKLINKVIPDARAAAPQIAAWDGTSMESIPDELLESIVKGTAKSEDVEKFKELEEEDGG